MGSSWYSIAELQHASAGLTTFVVFELLFKGEHSHHYEDVYPSCLILSYFQSLT